MSGEIHLFVELPRQPGANSSLCETHATGRHSSVEAFQGGNLD